MFSWGGGSKSSDGAKKGQPVKERLVGSGPLAVELNPLVLVLFRHCALLTEASYKDMPADFLRQKGHRFNSLTVSEVEETQGRFLLATIDEGPEHKYAFAAIRGSVTGDDWKTNLSAWPSVGAYGGIHSGWYNRHFAVPRTYLEEKAKEGYTPVITGHSLGGAVAQIVAAEILDSSITTELETKARDTMCLTFSAPAPFLKARAERLNIASESKKHFFNFFREEDVVPRITTFIHQLLASVGHENFSSALGKEVLTWGQHVLMGEAVAKVPTAALQKLGLAVVSNAAGTIVRTEAALFQPVGYYIPVDDLSATPAVLTNEQLATLMDMKEFNFKVSSVAHHDIHQVIACTTKFLNAPLPSDRPKACLDASVQLPPCPDLVPQFKEVLVNKCPSGYEIRVFGLGLTTVSSFTHPSFAGRIQVSQIVSSKELSAKLPCQQLSCPIAASFDTLVSSCISRDAISLQSVPVKTKNVRPIDLTSVNDLVQSLCHIALYSRKTLPDTYDKLCMYLGELLLCLPGDQGLGVLNAVTDGTHCTEKIDFEALAASQGGRKMLEILKTEAEIPSPVKQRISEALKIRPNDPLCRCDLIKLLNSESIHDGKTLGKEFMEALLKPILEADVAVSRMQKDALKTYIKSHTEGMLKISILIAAPLCTLLGREEAQHDPREIDAALGLLVGNRRLHELIHNSSQYVGVAAALAFFGGLIAAPFTGGSSAWMSIAAVSIGLPAAILSDHQGAKLDKHSLVESRNRLATLVTKNIIFSWSDTEAKVAKWLDSKGVTGRASVTSIQSRIAAAPEFESFSDALCLNIARRIKLISLCADIRTILHELSPVVLIGPSRSGKTCLLDQLTKTKTATAGHMQKNRTRFPTMHRCAHHHDPSKFFVVLDTIGLSDDMFQLEGQAKVTGEHLCRLYTEVCGAAIRVMTKDPDDRPASKACRTATVDSSTVIRPSLTCFTHFDDNGTFPSVEDMKEEVEFLKMNNDTPLELRSATQFCSAPRVVACFVKEHNGKIPRAQADDETFKIWCAEDVREWVSSWSQ